MQTHGVKDTKGGRLILCDKTLFLLFVKLERARRLGDFDTIITAVESIESYVTKLDMRYLTVFAYLYVKFSDFSPSTTLRDVPLENGKVRKATEYRRPVSDEEVAVATWVRVKYDHYSDSFFRALYQNDCKT